MNVSGISTEQLKDLEFVYRDHDQRVYIKQEGLTKIAEWEALRARLMAARDKARMDAIKNLARYKFSNFGYHAARWVTLNQLIGGKQANPFSEFVQLARTMPEGNFRATDSHEHTGPLGQRTPNALTPESESRDPKTLSVSPNFPQGNFKHGGN